MNAPLVINDSLVHRFKYWNEGIHQGIRYNNELYTRVQTYSTTERLKAYETAHDQAKQGRYVCITVSTTHYEVWLSLRSLTSTTHRDRALSNARGSH